MSDRRPRNQRPRSRGGKHRLASTASERRQNERISALAEALEPEATALSASLEPDAIVEQIRAQATALASQRSEGDVTEVVEAALDEIFGLGPLEGPLRDAAVRSIRIQGAGLFANGEQVRGFRDGEHARRVVDRILRSMGEDLSAGPVRTTMMDGSTVAAHVDDEVLVVDIQRP